MKHLLPAVVLVWLGCGCFSPESTGSRGKGNTANHAGPFNIRYTVVASLPHDTSYFTEGLEYYKGQLWESSGGNMDESPYPSVFGKVNTVTGRNDPYILLDRRKYFAEGFTFFNDKLYWVMLDNGIGFEYDATTFKQLRQFHLPSIKKKGWGLTHDSTHLILSDGTNQLYYIQPDSLVCAKKLHVSDQHGPVNNLNELEYIDGLIFANQWLTSNILVIDPANGNVKGKIDLGDLQKRMDEKLPEYRELNGIAYNTATGRIMITGKKWPEMYEIMLIDKLTP